MSLIPIYHAWKPLAFSWVTSSVFKKEQTIGTKEELVVNLPKCFIIKGILKGDSSQTTTELKYSTEKRGRLHGTGVHCTNCNFIFDGKLMLLGCGVVMSMFRGNYKAHTGD